MLNTKHTCIQAVAEKISIIPKRFFKIVVRSAIMESTEMHSRYCTDQMAAFKLSASLNAANELSPPRPKRYHCNKKHAAQL